MRGVLAPIPCLVAAPARLDPPAGLADDISARRRSGFIRETSVAAEVESCRPLFNLGEVAAPGQYPYLSNMTVESAVANAGGFSPRALRDRVTVTRADAAGTARNAVPPGASVSPGETARVGERWF